MDEKRDKQIIAVVEKPSDIGLMESQDFNGLYHVLHGVMSPRDGIGPDQLRIRELISRVEQNSINEIILSLPGAIEGEATAYAIVQELHRAQLSAIKLSMPALNGDRSWLHWDNWVAESKGVDLYIHVIIETNEKGKRQAQLIRLHGPLTGVPWSQALVFSAQSQLESGQRKLRICTVNAYVYWSPAMPGETIERKVSRHLRHYINGLMGVDENFRVKVLSQLKSTKK